MENFISHSKSKEDSMEIVSTYLPLWVISQLKKEAEDADRTLTAIIRRILREYVEKQIKKEGKIRKRRTKKPFRSERK